MKKSTKPRAQTFTPPAAWLEKVRAKLATMPGPAQSALRRAIEKRTGKPLDRGGFSTWITGSSPPHIDAIEAISELLGIASPIYVVRSDAEGERMARARAGAEATPELRATLQARSESVLAALASELDARTFDRDVLGVSRSAEVDHSLWREVVYLRGELDQLRAASPPDATVAAPPPSDELDRSPELHSMVRRLLHSMVCRLVARLEFVVSDVRDDVKRAALGDIEDARRLLARMGAE